MILLRSFFKYFLVVLSHLITINASGQKKSAPAATWVMPGISYQLTPKFRLFTQLGISDYQHMKYVFTQGFIDLNKHVSVSAGHFYLQSNGISRFSEHDIVVAAVFSRSFGKLVLDDRNMFRKVMITNNPGDIIYRNRVRASYPFSFHSETGTFYLFDEGYYSTNKGLWSRNRIGSGMSYNIFRQMNLDVSYILQDDIFSGKTHLIFMQLTVNLKRKRS